MRRIIYTMCIIAAALVPALAADTVAQRLAAAKAACPDCYRVINTNGVYFGVTKAEYPIQLRRGYQPPPRIK